MATAYPSFTALLGLSSASDIFPDDDIVRAGHVSHRDKADTRATYLWKVDTALLLIKRHHGIISPLFRGPQSTTWRLHIDWGDRRLENTQRYVKVTLSFLGSIQSQLRFRAGYEIFKGKDEYRIGHVDLDGSEYKLQTSNPEGGEQAYIEWVHHKDLSHVLQSALEKNGSLYVGVNIQIISDQSRFDFRPHFTMKNNVPDIPGAQDLLLVGRNGLKITAHKSYLSTWSSRMSDEIENLGDASDLDMGKYHGQTLKTLVEFLYMGDLNETSVQEHGVDLLTLTEDYGLFILQPRICDYLRRNLWREGLLQTFLIADTKPDDEEYLRLRDSAVLMIRQNMTVTVGQSEGVEGLTREDTDFVRKRVLEISRTLPVLLLRRPTLLPVPRMFRFCLVYFQQVQIELESCRLAQSQEQ